VVPFQSFLSSTLAHLSVFRVHFFLNSPYQPSALHSFFTSMLPGRLTTSSTSTPTNGGFEQECVSFFAEVVQLFGVPKSVGQIYGLLYASPAPLGFSDIVERLEISKGSASQGLQLLRSLGAIIEAERSSQISNLPSSIKRETRGVAYEPELSLRQLVTGVLRERIVPMASTGADRLKRIKELAEQAPENTKFYLGRAKQLETWRKRFTTVMPLFTVLLGPKKKNGKC
jgi:hypothetical protein